MSAVPKQRVIKPKAMSLNEALTKTEESKKGKVKREATVADQISVNAFHFAREYWPKSRELFPNEREMQICDKYYPSAKGGHLWVDEERITEARDFKRKEKVMAEQGHRYIVIKKNATLQETMEHIL
jgi:hypothetical protein